MPNPLPGEEVLETPCVWRTGFSLAVGFWVGVGLRAYRGYRQSLAPEGQVRVDFREGGEGLRSLWLGGGL